jgi:hypothetical protein
VGLSFDIVTAQVGFIALPSVVHLPSLVPSASWIIQYLADAIKLAVVDSSSFPGDFSHNGIVAAAYVVWRKGLGTTYTQIDFEVWRAHFGQTAAGSGSGVTTNAAAPEPTSALLFLMGVLAMLFRRRAGTS